MAGRYDDELGPHRIQPLELAKSVCVPRSRENMGTGFCVLWGKGVRKYGWNNLGRMNFPVG
jgi:hypothetical protein